MPEQTQAKRGADGDWAEPVSWFARIARISHVFLFGSGPALPPVKLSQLIIEVTLRCPDRRLVIAIERIERLLSCLDMPFIF